MAIRIITDSICDVPEEFVSRYGIRVLPLTVHFGEASYKDGVDLTIEQFLEKLEQSQIMPTTSQVPPMEFLSAYKEELAKGNEVISIHGSSKLSGTFNSAMMAKEQLGSEKIHVIDSEEISLGAGILVIKAARLAEEKLEAEAIIREIEASRARVRYYFVLDTLKYLHKGGRLSFSAAVVGSILNIKPILTVSEGKLELLGKARGISKAITSILETVEEKGWSLNGKIIGVNHIADFEHRNLLEEEIKKRYNVSEVIRGAVGSVVATHAGPGAVAFCFEAE